MSKKLLSILLCVLVVISSVSCLFTMSVSAASGVVAKELFGYSDIEGFGGDNLPVKLSSAQSTLLTEVVSKYSGRWLRASGGVAINTDLMADKATTWTSDCGETFPSWFGLNAQVVKDPINADNKAIRTVQSLQQYIDASEISTNVSYTLKFDYINRGPSDLLAKENYVDFELATPKGDDAGKVGTAFNKPFTVGAVTSVKKTDSAATASSIGTGIRITFGSNSTDTWQSVTVDFTLREEDLTLYNETVEERIILATFTQQVSNESVNGVASDDHAIYYDNISLTKNERVVNTSEFYNVNGEKIESNDYADVNVVANVDGTLTATVDYEKTNKAISFIGWYNGDTAMGYTESITFVADGSVVPTPRFLTYNRISELGSFEYDTTGDHLHYVEAMPESGKAPNYPIEGTWGIASNNGYVTYTDVTVSTSKIANTYTETIYKTDGTAVSQTEHQGRKVSGWKQETNLSVVDTVAHSGNKSFEIKSADMAYVSGINTEKSGTYTLSYYVNDISAIKVASGAFSSAILSTPNIGVSRTGLDVYYDDATKTSSVSSQLPNHMAAAIGICNDYTFDAFRSTKNLTDITLEEGQTWYKVTHTFTTTENHQKVYFAVYNNTGANVYVDDVTCYNATDVVSFFSPAKAIKDDMVTEIPNTNLYANISLSNAEVIGVPVTATVSYNTDDKTMRFIGWYNGDELISESTSVTVTPAEGDNYYPKFVTTNIMAGAASYENFAEGEHVGYAVNTPTDTDENGNLVEPVYGDNIRWSWNFNGGYITSNNGSDSKFAQNVYAGTIYGADGTAYTSTQSTGTRNATLNTSYPSYVTSDKAHSGEKSIAMSAAVARGLSVPVEGGKTYKLSFYAISDATSATNYAVTTTLNVGGSKGASHMITEDDGVNDYTKYRLAMGSFKPITEWGKAELTFTVPDVAELDTVYLVLYCSGSSASVPLYIDDLCCTEVTDTVIKNIEFIDVDGNVKETTNAYISGEIVNNLDGTYTAIADFENNGNVYLFDGWYDNEGALLSTDAEFVFEAGKYTASDLKAVIIDRNILDDSASFENYDVNTDLRVTIGTGDALADKEALAPTDNLWGVSYTGEYFKDNHFAIKTSNTVTWTPTVTNVQAYYDKVGADKFAGFFGADATVESVAASLADTIVPHTGDTMVAFSTKWRAGVRKINGLTANTQYTVSFYVYSTLIGERVSTVAIADSYDGVNTSNLEASAEDVNIISRLGVSTSQSDVRTWKKISISFNSGSNEFVYLHVHFNGTDNNSIFSPIYVDDLTVAETVTNYVGTAIRAMSESKPQALRYKFQITNDLITNGYADWEVEEYGSIAIRTHYLNGQELTLDGKYYGDSKERNIAKGVAYNKTNGTDIIFAKDVVNTEFTAALTGIGRKSDGSTNYLAWGDKYSVRNYIILKKGDNTVTVYGDTTAVASVFAVMDAILNSGNETDIATVNNILYNETNGEAIRAAYVERGYSLPETVE